ncbi:hypothetical protein [Alteromonas oceanisediminis]|uniref:hypothetical protein n=1 Tax=Alteromonas oceanisediminis TaxID=2836180 RepID=UPI001BDA57BA|nr:hypothetical protein [Alteromonas oceanisediminis]MBT0587373.1 hypothetical protein [Alteromonas oceanisediminis]
MQSLRCLATGVFTLTLASALLFFSVFSMADTKIEPTIVSKTYLVGVEDLEYYPLYTSHEKYPDKGLLITLIKEFARQNSLDFEFIALPIGRFSAWFESDNIDFRLPDNPHWHSDDAGLIFSKSILSLRTATVVLDSRKDWKLNQFTRIGTLHGFVPSPHWQARINNGALEIKSDSSMMMLVRMLYSDTVEGLDLDISVVKHYADKLGQDTEKLALAKKVKSPRLGYSMSTKHYPEVLTALNQFVDGRRDLIEELQKKYQLDGSY